MIQVMDMADSEEMSEYDKAYIGNATFERYREISVSELRSSFKKNDFVLDIGCGTGEEAVIMARQGIKVLAIDPSEDLLKYANKKIREKDLGDVIETRQMGAEKLSELIEDFGEEAFDGAYASFGVVNCIPDLDKFLTLLRKLLKSSAPFVCSVMNKKNLWEISAHLLMLRPKAAFRRFTPQNVNIKGIENRQFDVVCYDKNELMAIFKEYFDVTNVNGYPLLPPPYLDPLFKKLPNYLKKAVERDKGAMDNYGDHFFVTMEKL
jgi:ubiquinone/menaquinone biosynthesis C-methylase UbiE